MKRFLAVLTLAGITAGGAGVAWAHPFDGERAVKREAFRTCVGEAREGQPEATREELKDEVKACLEAKGFEPRQLTPEQRARRAKFRQCLQAARAEHPDADRATIRQAVKECVAG